MPKATYTIFSKTANPFGWNAYKAEREVGSNLVKAITALKEYKRGRLSPWTKYGILRTVDGESYQVKAPS